MALTRQKKHQKVRSTRGELQTATAAIIGTFTAMTAAKDFRPPQDRSRRRWQVPRVKNKLAPKAGAGTQIEGALGGLKGVSSIAYTSGDPVALAKALSTWVKDNAQFTFKLGIVDGKVLSVAEVNNLATLPGKEELFSKLLFLINAPGNASGYRSERHRPQPRRSDRSGCPAGEVCRPAKPRQPRRQKPLRQLRSSSRSSRRSPC